jgi:hypothetical protein
VFSYPHREHCRFIGRIKNLAPNGIPTVRKAMEVYLSIDDHPYEIRVRAMEDKTSAIKKLS